MLDTMIEKVKIAIYRHEGKRENEQSSFYDVMHKILEDRWNKGKHATSMLGTLFESKVIFYYVIIYIFQCGYLYRVYSLIS